MRLAKTEHNEKLLEYPKASNKSDKVVYKGPTVYYKDWCNFCEEKGVHLSLIAFAEGLVGAKSLEVVPSPELTYIYACGAKYDGKTMKIKRDGTGKLQLPTGDIYEGEFKGGKRSGLGRFHYGKGSETGYYKGEWMNDLRHGSGEEVFLDGSRFQGIWKEGKQAFGVLTWIENKVECKYEGGFNGENIDGYGVLFDGKRILEGYWKESILEGQGEEKYVGDSLWHYTGEWKNGKYHGKGELVNDTGTYKGGFMNGHYEGYGEFVHKDGEIRYKGNWKKGLYDGYGEYINSNGELYKGNFEKGKKEGYGEIQYSSGLIYKGKWSNNMRNGAGEVKWQNGDFYIGEFNNDKYGGKGKIFSKIDNNCAHVFEGDLKEGFAHGKGTLVKVYEELVNYVLVKSREVYTGDFAKGQFDGKWFDKL